MWLLATDFKIRDESVEMKEINSVRIYKNKKQQEVLVKIRLDPESGGRGRELKRGDGSGMPLAQIVVCAGGDESTDKEQPVRRGPAECRWKQQTGKA